MTDDRGSEGQKVRRSEVRGQTTEVRGQGTEGQRGRDQGAEKRKQKT
jgi:hypothetical protein